MIIVVRLFAAALLLAFSSSALAGERHSTRSVTIQEIDRADRVVTLIATDGTRIIVDDSDLTIVDMRRVRAELPPRTRGRDADRHLQHNLSVDKLKELSARGEAATVARIKYQKDGSIRKVRLLVCKDAEVASRVAASIEQQERERANRAAVPRER